MRKRAGMLEVALIMVAVILSAMATVQYLSLKSDLKAGLTQQVLRGTDEVLGAVRYGVQKLNVPSPPSDPDWPVFEGPDTSQEFVGLDRLVGGGMPFCSLKNLSDAASEARLIDARVRFFGLDPEAIGKNRVAARKIEVVLSVRGNDSFDAPALRNGLRRLMRQNPMLVFFDVPDGKALRLTIDTSYLL